MPTYPSVDESLGRLRRAGWSVGDTAFGPEHALVGYVSGSNGENAVNAQGRTRAEAHWRACIQAREVGMLAPPRLAVILSGVTCAFPRSTHR